MLALIYMERCITTTEVTTLPICSTLKVPSCPFAVPQGGDCTPALGPDDHRCLLPIPTVLPFLESHRVMLVQTSSHFPSSDPCPLPQPPSRPCSAPRDLLQHVQVDKVWVSFLLFPSFIFKFLCLWFVTGSWVAFLRCSVGKVCLSLGV